MRSRIEELTNSSETQSKQNDPVIAKSKKEILHELSADDLALILVLGEVLNKGVEGLTEAAIQTTTKRPMTKVKLSLKNLKTESLYIIGTMKNLCYCRKV